MRKTSIISAVIIGSIVLAACSQPGSGAKASKEYSVEVMVGAPSEAAGARGVAADSNVTHVDITVKKSDNTTIASGTLTKNTGSYFSGSLTINQTGTFTFLAEAQNSFNTAIYKGNADFLVSSDTRVTMYLAPCSGLVGEWLFSGSANDTSGNANNGTVSGATLAADRFSVASKAYSFNGSGVITVPYSSSLDFGTGDFSVSIWFKSSDTLTSGATLVEKIDGSQNGYGIYANANISGDISAYDYSDAGISTPSAWVDGSWHNVVYVRSGTSLKLYLNAAQVATGTSSRNSVSTLSNLTIGNSTILGIPYTGLLDDLRIYNVALNANQIGALYHEGGYGM